MAISVVQSKTGSTTEPTAVSFTSLPTAGNSVIVVFNDNGDHDISTVADNQGNTYTAVVDEKDSTGVNTFAGVYWCQTIGSPSGTFTVTCTPNTAIGNKMGVLIIEASGVGGVDQTGVANDGGTNPTSLTVTASAQNTSANDLAVYSIVIKGAAGNAAFFSAGATSGWTNDQVLNATNNGIGSCCGHKLLSALETTQAVSQTWTTGTACAGVVATFSPAGNVNENLTAQTITSAEGTIPPGVSYSPTAQSALFAEGQITISGQDVTSQAGGTGSSKSKRKPRFSKDIFREEMAKLQEQATVATEQRIEVEEKLKEPVSDDMLRYIADFERALKRAQAIERRQAEAVEVPVYFRLPAKSEGVKRVEAHQRLQSLAKIARHREEVAVERLRKVRERIDEEAATAFMQFIMWDD